MHNFFLQPCLDVDIWRCFTFNPKGFWSLKLSKTKSRCLNWNMIYSQNYFFPHKLCCCWFHCISNWKHWSSAEISDSSSNLNCFFYQIWSQHRRFLRRLQSLKLKTGKKVCTDRLVLRNLQVQSTLNVLKKNETQSWKKKLSSFMTKKVKQIFF